MERPATGEATLNGEVQMGIDEVFLKAIFDNPDDDTPRLIYADWLEERGDPRGQFIHVECALAKLEPNDPLRAELEVQREALLFQHEEEWFGRLKQVTFPSWPRSGWVSYRRGFPETIFVEAKTFLDHADEIFQLAPIRHLALTRAAQVMRSLAACPHLGRLRTLEMEHNGLGDEEAQLLAASPCVNGLAVLNMNSNHVGDAGARALAGSFHLARLAELHLAANRVGDVGAQAFASSPHLGSLILLDLRGNLIDGRRKPARAIRERFGDALRT